MGGGGEAKRGVRGGAKAGAKRQQKYYTAFLQNLQPSRLCLPLSRLG